MWRYILFCISFINIACCTNLTDSGVLIPSTNASKAVTSKVCPSNKFKCANEKCIPTGMVCDKDDDCGDNSDESTQACQKVKPSTCSPEQFRCKTGLCIPKLWMCDGEVDCPEVGGSDEETSTCENVTCSSDKFACTENKGRCIPKTWVCDGEPDCDDGSDEKTCNNTCGFYQFTCANAECIFRSYVCNGDDDCGDGSDEVNCPNRTCKMPEQFTCLDGHCISAASKCDGDKDCPDGSDEANCTLSSPKTVMPCSGFLCKDGITCVRLPLLCDGNSDCPDGDDEDSKKCSSHTCSQDQFQCIDHSCISEIFHCDRHIDCSDGSDELNCTNICNKNIEFDCGDGSCIPLSNVCDKKADCLNLEDESNKQCGENECAINNGGCAQRCIDTRNGYVCDCENGYRLVNNTICEDIDECSDPSSCSQVCTNGNGTYGCDCLEGYEKDPRDWTRCRSTQGQASILFAGDLGIGKISLRHFEIKKLVNNTNVAVALDYVFKTKMVYWSDVEENKIYKAPIEGVNQRTVVVNQVTSCGLAVDWIYNRLYWTDSIRKHIQLSDFHGELKKILLKDDIDEPRAIVLNPLDGWMYWTDRGKVPKIERAGMDGTNRQIIISRELRWPHGLALDLVRERVYWVDEGFNTIFSCNYDGSARRLIYYSSYFLRKPTYITTFEDFMYWGDLDKRVIFRANKFNGAVTRAVSPGELLAMSIQVYHSLRQPAGVNHCANSNCSHWCLPSPQIVADSTKFSCACPDDQKLSADSRTCVDTSKSTVLEDSSNSTENVVMGLVYSLFRKLK